ncbi:MAG: DEAD/DEAH box helicase [Gemmatimonadales bacterium]|nr:DEAD/DEAH box helicase [Gemmatimonadales bacterium]
MPASTPAIIAEALAAVPSPLQTGLRIGAPAPVDAVARAIARSLAPGEAPDAPPTWLRPEQAVAFRRVLYAVDRFRGAVLADPVGTGKTYVALAVAQQRCHGEAVVCIVPPALVRQWRHVADTLGLSVLVWSHARVSRGALPSARSSLVLIDESHHFRNTAIRRYEHLAPWITGQRAVLITATPVVNRLTDLGNQLRLVVRDDALLDAGLPSITQVLRYGHTHPALEHLVLRSSGNEWRHPTRRDETVQRQTTSKELALLLETIDSLSHSTNRSVQALIRAVFWRAAGSSPQALLGCARRYHRLLRHAQDARESGRSMSRSALHWFTAGAEDQLVFWPLLTDGENSTDLDLGDIQKVEGLISQAQARARGPDTKCHTLKAILADRRPTLVFTTARDTVSYLRRHLNIRELAWCSGTNAGIGSTPLPRAVVLDWFRPGVARPTCQATRPTVLLCTDVAAEGLNLQAAARVVHYDLPWTSVRLGQRDGRALRLGSKHAQIEVISFPLPEALEKRLRQQKILYAKGGLPVRLGLAGRPTESWRWRTELAQQVEEGPCVEGCATIRAHPRGILAGFSIHGYPDPGSPKPANTASAVRLLSVAVWIGVDGAVSENPEVITQQVLVSASCRGTPGDSGQMHQAVATLTPVIRDHMRRLRQARWTKPQLTPDQRRVIQALQDLATQSARHRDVVALGRISRALHFVRGGHTAGEDAMLRELTRLSKQGLIQRLPSLPQSDPEIGALEVRINGLILFVGEGTT